MTTVPRGSRYIPPTTRAQYSGNAVTLAAATAGNLTWDTLQVGDALLNLSVPALPTVVSAGVYALSFQVASASPLTAGTFFRVSAIMDVNGDFATIDAYSQVGTALDTTPTCNGAIVYFLPAGGAIRLRVANLDGTLGHDFSIANALLQPLS